MVAVAATRALGSLLFDVAAVDAATFVAMSTSALSSAWWPATCRPGARPLVIRSCRCGE
ncbi:MAG: hypothetical protein R2752_14255 [Vicinamibacterales bacterium]